MPILFSIQLIAAAIYLTKGIAFIVQLMHTYKNTDHDLRFSDKYEKTIITQLFSFASLGASVLFFLDRI